MSVTDEQVEAFWTGYREVLREMGIEKEADALDDAGLWPACEGAAAHPDKPPAWQHAEGRSAASVHAYFVEKRFAVGAERIINKEVRA